MNKWLVLGLRFILICGLLGSVFVQVVMVPLIAADMSDEPDRGLVAAFVIIIVLGIVTIQVTMVCVWRLLTMVARRTVFSHSAFRYVDVIMGAVLVAALLAFVLGAILAPTSVAPGVVLLIGGAGGLILGVALVVAVLRALLGQAVALEVEATGLKDELDGVI